MYRTRLSFISSDGWNWIGPAANHRRAPLTDTPTCGTSTASNRQNDTSTIVVTSFWVKIDSPRLASTFIPTSPTAPKIR